MKRSSKASAITLRQAYDRHYDRSVQCRGSQQLTGYCLTIWERLTTDPPISEIANETVAAFREAALKAGYAPRTVNGVWHKLRAILRRVGPPVTGNPFGLSLIKHVPAMKPCKVAWKMPKRIDLEALSKFYIALRGIQYPMRSGMPAPEIWRALLVLAFTTGLRKADLLKLTFDQIDFEKGELHVEAGKTGKYDVFPLSAVAVQHLARIKTDRKRIFAGMSAVGSRFYNLLHKIQDAAKIERFGLHDVRRTAASEIDRVPPRHGPRALATRPPRRDRDVLHERDGRATGSHRQDAFAVGVHARPQDV